MAGIPNGLNTMAKPQTGPDTVNVLGPKLPTRFYPIVAVRGPLTANRKLQTPNRKQMTKQLTIQTNETKRWFEPIPGQRIAVCVRGKDTNGSSAVIEGIVAPKSFAPLHIHKNEDELFRVLKGTLHFAVEDREFEAKPGSVIVAPRGVAHGWSNFSQTDAHVMAMLVPAGFELFFEEMDGRPMSDLPELAAKHGCQVLPPH